MAMSTSTRWALVAVLAVPWVAGFLAVAFAGTPLLEASQLALLGNVAVVIVGAVIFVGVLLGTPPRLDADLRERADARGGPTASTGEEFRIELTPGGPFTLSGRPNPEVAKEFMQTFGPLVGPDVHPPPSSPEEPQSPHTSKHDPQPPPPSQAS